MSSRVTTVTDCGTSRRGVGVLVALLIVSTPYPAGAVTLTLSRMPATCRVRQSCGMPARHQRQAPQVAIGSAVTRSPTATPATPPKPNPEFFCPGISSYVEALTLVDLMFELHGKDGMKLGFVTSDVPGARIVAQKIMAPYAEKKGATVVDVAVAPMATNDLGPIVRNLQDKGANAIISYTYNHHMLGAADAVDRLKFQGKYLLVAELPGVLARVLGRVGVPA